MNDRHEHELKKTGLISLLEKASCNVKKETKPRGVKGEGEDVA